MITIEYPCYYTKFKCIAGECPNTCCKGWEVDVDEDSASFYQIYPGAFGDRLRKTLCTENGAAYFPGKEDGRCPFLDEKGLCEIYSNIGEGALCVTCDEYPRYFAQFPGYEIRDLSLSCPEAARIVFTETDEIIYLREDTDDEDVIADDEPNADPGRLFELLERRNRMIEAFKTMDAERFGAEYLRGCEADEKLLTAAGSMEAVNENWTDSVRRLNTNVGTLRNADLYKLENSEEIHQWFVKLAIYFTYRYLTDEMYGETKEHEERLLFRSLRMIYLMCCEKAAAAGSLNVSDMIELTGLYSRQVEHSEESLYAMKGID